MTPRPYKPVEIGLIDGRQVKLALSFAGFQRALAHFGVDDLSKLVGSGAEKMTEVAVVMFHQALPRELRESISCEELGELLPGHPKELNKMLEHLLGYSMPDPDPNAGAPAAESPVQLLNGRASGALEESGSDSAKPNSGT